MSETPDPTAFSGQSGDTALSGKTKGTMRSWFRKLRDSIRSGSSATDAQSIEDMFGFSGEPSEIRPIQATITSTVTAGAGTELDPRLSPENILLYYIYELLGLLPIELEYKFTLSWQEVRRDKKKVLAATVKGEIIETNIGYQADWDGADNVVHAANRERMSDGMNRSFDLTPKVARKLNGLAGSTFRVDTDDERRSALKMMVREVVTDEMMQSRLNQDGKDRLGNIEVTFRAID